MKEHKKEEKKHGSTHKPRSRHKSRGSSHQRVRSRDSHRHQKSDNLTKSSFPSSSNHRRARSREANRHDHKSDNLTQSSFHLLVYGHNGSSPISCSTLSDHSIEQSRLIEKGHGNASLFLRNGSQNSEEDEESGPQSYTDSMLHLQKLEKAASLIQSKFRESSQIKQRSRRKVGFADQEKKVEYDMMEEIEIPEEKDLTHVVTLLFIVFYSCGTMLMRCIKSLSDSGGVADDIGKFGGADSGFVAEGAPPGTSGPSPGMETMATQAASSAAGSAGSAATAVAGAATGAATTTAVAGGLAAAAGSSQVITAVAVTAAVATVGASTGVFKNSEPTSPDILSTCGIINPEIRAGSFGMSFEGFERKFSSREIVLLEGLVVDSYNDLTRGNDQNTTGCVDEYLREMQNATLNEQRFEEGDNETLSVLDTVFNAWVVCKGCPLNLPLFGSSNENSSGRFLLVGDEAIQTILNVKLIEEHLKVVVEGIIQLIGSGELPETFVPKRAYVKAPNAVSEEEGGEGPSSYVVNIPLSVNIDESGGLSVSFPDSHTQTLQLSFEGFDREFSPQEAALVAKLVMVSYNNVVSSEGGGDVTSGNVDPFRREISSTSLTEQVFQEATDSAASTLEIAFEVSLSCEGCNKDLPLFGGSSDSSDVGLAQLDVSLMTSSLKAIVAKMIDSINGSELPTSFVPTNVNIRPPEGFDEDQYLVGIPIASSYLPDGSIVVVIPDDSSCGLTNPELHAGSFRLSFAGFKRAFTKEERGIVESIAIDAYNKVSKGTNYLDGNLSCEDEYLREMSSTTLVQQVFQDATGDGDSTLNMSFAAWVTCKGCPKDMPIFGTVDDTERNGRRLVEASLDVLFLERFAMEVSLRLPRELPADSFAPTKVFIKASQEEGDGPENFLVNVQISVLYDEDGNVVSVIFPMSPNAPSEPPSYMPSAFPSESPSVAESVLPSPVPSEAPSSSPSMSISPSIMESFGPTLSLLPSSKPSTFPSRVPSSFPSQSPSKLPSSSPSKFPSVVPSFQPSQLPSGLPSESPSSNPSISPSSTPSRLPSTTPSLAPTTSMSPSLAPSQSPSAMPSVCASPIPTCGGQNSCDNLGTPQNELGCGACTGRNSCKGAGTVSIGGMSCGPGRAACNEVGSGSSIGHGSCKGNWDCHLSQMITVGDNSCNGVENSDFKAYGCRGLNSVTIGDNACNCHGCCACLGPGTTVASNTCNNPGDCCTAKGGPLVYGTGSCVTPVAGIDYSCFGMWGSSGASSCIGDHACRENKATSTGSSSCIGYKACRDVHGTSTIGDGSCSGDESCGETTSITVGAGSCIGLEACKGLSGVTIGPGSCNCDGCCKCLASGSTILAGTCNALGSGQCCT